MPPITRRAVTAAAAIVPGLALGQTPAPPRPRILMTTGAGPITIELAVDKAPKSCANILRYVDSKRLDGGAFYRAMKIAAQPLTGLVQGGVTDGAKLLPPVAHEPTTETGLHHTPGAVSLARLAPGSATCDMFICVGDMTGLDADPKQSGDNLGFAVFGQVVDGMPAVLAIMASPVSATAGEGVMKGQMLEPKIPILTVRRV